MALVIVLAAAAAVTVWFVAQARRDALQPRRIRVKADDRRDPRRHTR